MKFISSLPNLEINKKITFEHYAWQGREFFFMHIDHCNGVRVVCVVAVVSPHTPYGKFDYLYTRISKGQTNARV